MGLTACTEPQCLYKGALYRFTLVPTGMRNTAVCHQYEIHSQTLTKYFSILYILGPPDPRGPHATRSARVILYTIAYRFSLQYLGSERLEVTGGAENCMRRYLDEKDM